MEDCNIETNCPFSLSLCQYLHATCIGILRLSGAHNVQILSDRVFVCDHNFIKHSRSYRSIFQDVHFVWHLWTDEENGRGSKVELLIKSSRDWTNCAYILKFGRIIIIVQDNDSDWHLDDIVVLRVPRRVHSVLNGHQELKRVLALQQKKKRE